MLRREPRAARGLAPAARAAEIGESPARRLAEGCGSSGRRLRRRSLATSIPSSRSRSPSSFHAPTEARSHGRPGMLRTTTPPSASRARSASGSALSKETERALAARGDARCRARPAAPPAARRASSRARAPRSSRPTRAARRPPARRRAVSALSDMRVQAAGVLVQLRRQALVRVGQVGVAAPGDLQPLAQRRADVQHARSRRGRTATSARRRRRRRSRARARRPGPRRRPGRRRAAPGRPPPPAPPARGCRSSSRRASRRPGACCGPTAFGDLRQRHRADRDAAQLARRDQRAEQPGVLLVAGHDLIARARAPGRRSPARCPSLVRGRQREVRRVAAERRGVERAQLPAQLGAPFEMRRACVPARPRAQLRRRRPARRARAAARRCRRSGTPAARRTGNSARNPVRSTNRENTRMSSADLPDTPVGTDGAGSRARRDDALHALGGRAPRRAVRRLRRAVALVGGGAGGVLGEHLGVLRGARVEALRARARLAARCRARAGSRGPSSTTPRTCCWAHPATRSGAGRDPGGSGGPARLRAARAASSSPGAS